MIGDYRFYKGVYPVQILVQGKKQCLVLSALQIPFMEEKFVTIPRLLWRHKKSEDRKRKANVGGA